MTRQLLRDGRIVDDDWIYATEMSLGAQADPSAASSVILSLEQWLAEKTKWLATGGRLGVVLLPAHKIEQLATDLAHFDLVGAEFPGPSEGRGYTQGRLLRERYQFQGELRATGYVRRDQLFLLARCGFNSFELPASEFASASGALATFSAEYQPANDAGLTRKLHRR
jgi:uncharacterized protein (DUF934 family)